MTTRRRVGGRARAGAGKQRVLSPTPPVPHSPAPVGCPFCESSDTELVSLFGTQLLVSQFRCRACQSYFEAVRDDYGPLREEA